MKTIILFAVLFLIFNTCVIVSTKSIRILGRNDGEFDYIKDPDGQVPKFFQKNPQIKSIKLSTVITQPYRLKLAIGADTYTLYVPRNYVTDGASKPFKRSPVPNDFEGGYWVYHDYMYQRQAFDDGTPITKDMADSIMELLIFTEWKSIIYPYKFLYKLIVFCYKYNCDKYWSALKSRGCAFLVNDTAGQIRLSPDQSIVFRYGSHLDG